MMKKIVVAVVLTIVACGSAVNCAYADGSTKIDDAEINKILKAKEIVRGMVNFPDTLVFFEFFTKVSGNTVTLKFTAKNGFGVAETHVKDIKVN